MVFTGDIAFSGQVEQYEGADRILADLWRQVGLDPVPRLLVAVPGNHDLRRPEPKEGTVVALGDWVDKPDVREAFWARTDSDYHRVVHECFRDFSAWWGAQTATAEPSYIAGILPGDFSLSFEKEGARLGIAGLNSSFLQLTDGNYRERLAVHARQIHALCGGDAPQWCRSHHACILLTHHPPEWLCPEARAELLTEIAPPQEFALHLFGHMHKTMYRQVSLGATEARRQWQGTSFYGRQHYHHEGRIEDRRHGYTMGVIAFDGQEGRLRVWPRRARAIEGAGWSLIPDYEEVELEDDQGTPTVIFPLRMPYEDRGSNGGSAGEPPPAPTSRSRPDAVRRAAAQVPGDYQPRHEVEVSIRAWWSGEGLSVAIFLSGPSGAGKTATVAKLFGEAAERAPLNRGGAVWLQLSELQSSIQMARSIADQILALFPDDSSGRYAAALVDRAEMDLSKCVPQLIVGEWSAGVRATYEGAQLPGGTSAAPPGRQPRPALSGDSYSTDRPGGIEDTSPAGRIALARSDAEYPGMLRRGVTAPRESAQSIYSLAQVRQSRIYAAYPPADVLRQLADDMARALSAMDLQDWTLFVDTLDWMQAGASPALSPDPQLPSSWLIDHLIPAMNARGLRLLAVIAGQLAPEEVTSRLSEYGLQCSSISMDRFTEEEFEAFVSSKDVTNPHQVSRLARMTDRIPHVTRVWFDVMGEGERNIPTDVEEAAPPEQLRAWLWPRLRRRLPGLLPELFRAAAALPAFDKELLSAATGVGLSSQVWDRFRGYSLLEVDADYRPGTMYRVKQVWAQALTSDLPENERVDICRRALRDLLRRSRRLVGDLESTRRSAQERLSLLAARTASSLGTETPEAWHVFMRETAKWLVAGESSVGRQLVRMAEGLPIGAAQTRALGVVRDCWREVEREDPRRPAILSALLVLLEADYDIPGLTEGLLRSAFVFALGRRDKALLRRLRGRADEKGCYEHEQLLLVRCREHLILGERDAALMLMDSVPTGAESAETLGELGRFCEDELHDLDRAIRLYTASHKADPAAGDSLAQLTRLLRQRGRCDQALQMARDAASAAPDRALVQWCLGECLWWRSPRRVAGALSSYEKALRLDPAERRYCSHFALALRESIGVEEARVRLEALSEEFPGSAWLAETTGRSYAGYHPRDWPKAAEWHEKAVRLKPNEQEFAHK